MCSTNPPSPSSGQHRRSHGCSWTTWSADGNTVVLVDHDTQILSHADHIVEMGPGAGADGGRVIAQGTVGEIVRSPASRIGPFLAARSIPRAARRAGRRTLRTRGDPPLHLRDSHRKTARSRHSQRPPHGGDGRIGIWQTRDSRKPRSGARSGDSGHAAATPCEKYRCVGYRTRQAHRFDTHRCQRALHGGYLRRYSRRAAQDLRPHARCPGLPVTRPATSPTTPDGCVVPCATAPARLSHDVQFLPDVDIPCPECRGSRYAKPAGRIACTVGNGRSFTLPPGHGGRRGPCGRSCAPDSRASHRGLRR